MACPGNIQQVLRQFRKATTELTSDQIIIAAGGSDSEWGQYLRGPKTQAIIRSANLFLIAENCEIVSSGIGTERWRMVTCAQARVEQAHQQTAKATNHIRNAEENMWLVVHDERAPKRLREDAEAWLRLFDESKHKSNVLIFKEWADELLKQLPHIVAA